MTTLARDLNNEDYEYSNSYSSIGNGSDIFKRINAMLDGTLELNTAATNNEQVKDALPKMPHVVSGPHSQQGYHDSQYNNTSSSYPKTWILLNANYSNALINYKYGFQTFCHSTDQQPFPQYKLDDFPTSKQYEQDDYQSNYKPNTNIQQSKDAYCHQNTDLFNVPYSKSLVDTNSTHYKIESMMALAKAAVKETPQKQLRAIRGSPGTSDYSDYDSSPGTPGTPGTSHNETLSPIDQIFGLMSSSQSRQRNRCTPPFDLDISENSSDGSEAALIDMMNVLKLSTREASSPINDLSKQLYTAQQQQHQHQQQASLQQHHQQQVSLEQQRQQASLQQQQLSFQQHQQAQHQKSLVMYQQAQQAQQQQKNLMMYRQVQQAQQQRQLMAVPQAANQPSLQPTSQLALTGSAESIAYSAPAQVMQPFAIANLDPYAIDRAARLHRSAAGNAMCEASCTWSGNIPPKNYKNPTTFSCKVFLGGVPWDITEAGLQASFNKFGLFKIEWPGRDGYVYLLFESEKAVRVLLQECIHDYSTGEYFYHISSRRMRSKEVQVIPWMLSESNFIRQPSQRLDANKTVFVGALHGMISAETLSNIMDDLFGNVAYTGIDSDKHKYPIGSGRVTFSSQKSYMKAVQAAFVELKTPKFTKKIQIDPYLEDSICSLCNLQQGSYFCRDLQCFRYFCRTCWYWKHEPDHMRTHKPLSRNTKGQMTVGLM